MGVYGEGRKNPRVMTVVGGRRTGLSGGQKVLGFVESFFVSGQQNLHVYFIKPEKNCYVTVYEHTGWQGVSEVYVRKEDIGFFQDQRNTYSQLSKYDIDKPPQSRGTGFGNGKCPEFWTNNWDICEWWANAVYSMHCECVFDNEKTVFADKIDATDEDGKIISKT